jgi:hypothetical protein
MPACRFPPPWSAEVTPNCFIVRDANGQALMKTNPVAAQRLSCSGNLTSFEGDPLQSFQLFSDAENG